MITPDDVLSAAAYEKVRAERRARVIRLRELRRVELGPWVSVVFENRETVLYQIQEMVRIERLAEREKVQFEIDTYSELLPAPGELSATLFIEIADEEERRRALPGLQGIERALSLKAGDAAFPAEDKRPIDPAFSRPQAACVYYLRIALPPVARQAVRSGSPPVRLQIEHPRYSHAAPLGPEQLAELAKDLQ